MSLTPPRTADPAEAVNDTERLRNREDGSRTLARGRLVSFLRRDAAGAWRIRLLINSHSHPMEPIE
jgi:hypothetical protein